MMELPTREEVKESYDKPDLFKEIDKYYSDKDALREFVWILQNKAWKDGYNTGRREYE